MTENNAKLTILFPYHEEPDRIKLTVAKYKLLPLSQQAILEILIIDTGPKNSTSLLDAYNTLNTESLAIRAFKIAKYRKWNNSIARNIGFYEAKTKVVFTTDSDHWLDTESLAEILRIKETKKTLYSFRRIQHENGHSRATKPHSNSFLCSKETFFLIGGYDEKFDGNYGREDNDFLTRAINSGINHAELPIFINTQKTNKSDDRSRSILVNKWKRRLRLPFRKVPQEYFEVNLARENRSP